jgi:hypothetical protein
MDDILRIDQDFQSGLSLSSYILFQKVSLFKPPGHLELKYAKAGAMIVYMIILVSNQAPVSAMDIS